MENQKQPEDSQTAEEKPRVTWEYEPGDDSQHRLNLIFNLLLSYKLR